MKAYGKRKEPEILQSLIQKVVEQMNKEKRTPLFVQTSFEKKGNAWDRTVDKSGFWDVLLDDLRCDFLKTVQILFIGHNFRKQSDVEKINYSEFMNAMKDKIWDNDKQAAQTKKPVDSKDLEAAIALLRKEAEELNVNLKDLFISGSTGDPNGFLTEEWFKDCIYKERMRMNNQDIDNLISHFFDLKSNKVNVGNLLRQLEVRIPVKSNTRPGATGGKDWDGKSTQASDKIEMRKIKKMLIDKGTKDDFIYKIFE